MLYLTLSFMHLSYLQNKCEPPVYVSDRRLVKSVALAKVEPLGGVGSLLPVVVGCWSVLRLRAVAVGGMLASNLWLVTAEWMQNMQ